MSFLTQSATVYLILICLGINTAFSQNVGIGTNTPNTSAKLEIVDANRGLLLPRVALTSTTVAAPVASPANWLVVFNTQNINDVSEGMYYWNGTRWVRFSTSNDWTLLGNSGTNPTTNFIGTTDAQDFVFRTNNTEKMRVLSSGNVGIATSAPLQRLDVAGNVQSHNDYFVYVTFPANYAIGDYIEFAEANTMAAQAGGHFEVSYNSTRNNYASAATFIASASHANSYNVWRELAMANSNPYVLSAGGHNFTIDINPLAYGVRPRFRIRAINTIGDVTVPCGVSIRIRSINTNAGWAAINNTGSGATVAGFAKMTSEWNLITGNVSVNSNGNLAITAIENGNVGLGTRTPTEKLQVVGNGLFSGNVTAACGVLVCSDQRYKKEIQPLQNALPNLMRLQGVTYNWKKEEFPNKNFDDRLQIGVIAQDLEKIYPELVNTDAQGFKTVDYPKFTPILIEAVKSQQAQIQALEQKMQAQAQENALLKAKLGELDELKAELQAVQNSLKAHK